MKKHLSLMLILILVLVQGLAIAATAASLPDLTQKGSLTIVMQYQGEKLDDGRIRICRIADIQEETAQFRLIEALQGEDIPLENPQDPAVAQKALDSVLEKRLPAITAPITDGAARFENLETGLYLVYQTQRDAVSGFAPITPFLISIPYLSEGEYVMDVKAEPKVPMETKPTRPTEPPPTRPNDPHLPQTGQLNWPVPMLAVGGLTLFLVGWFLYNDRHRKNNEA